MFDLYTVEHFQVTDAFFLLLLGVRATAVEFAARIELNSSSFLQSNVFN